MISRQGQIRRQKECAIPLPLPFGGSGPKDLGQGTLSNTVSVIFVNYELFKMAEEGGRLCHGMKMSCFLDCYNHPPTTPHVCSSGYKSFRGQRLRKKLNQILFHASKGVNFNEIEHMYGRLPPTEKVRFNFFSRLEPSIHLLHFILCA